MQYTPEAGQEYCKRKVIVLKENIEKVEEARINFVSKNIGNVCIRCLSSVSPYAACRLLCRSGISTDKCSRCCQ